MPAWDTTVPSESRMPPLRFFAVCRFVPRRSLTPAACTDRPNQTASVFLSFLLLHLLFSLFFKHIININININFIFSVCLRFCSSKTQAKRLVCVFGLPTKSCRIAARYAAESPAESSNPDRQSRDVGTERLFDSNIIITGTYVLHMADV